MQKFKWDNRPKKNEAQVNAIKEKLANLMEIFESRPTSNTKKKKKKKRNRNNMQEIVECILEFIQLNQSGPGVKVLAPN